MKLAMPVMLCLVLLCGACSSTPEPRYMTNPRTYDETMARIAHDVGQTDKFLIGGQYTEAMPHIERMISDARDMADFEPLRTRDRYGAYTEFRAQVDDLHRAAERLRFLAEQRRPHEAESLLAEVAVRYNRLSMNYGPGQQLGVLERSPHEFRFTQEYRSGAAGR